MTREALADLLRDADAAAPPPPTLPLDLAGRVRRKAAAQARRRRNTAAAALVVAGATAAAWVALPPQADVERAVVTATAPAAPATVARSELVLLRAQAAMHSTVAATLQSREDRRRIAEPAAAPTVQSERDKAALALLDHADRLRRDLNQVDAALAAYRRTVEMFPETRWAAVARARIEQLAPGARARAREDLLA